MDGASGKYSFKTIDMSYSTRIKIFLVFALLLFVFGRYGLFYLDKAWDTQRRPWAYSKDPDKPLLVGRWQGQCVDPDGITHQISMEIVEPLTDKDRMKRINRARAKRKRSKSSPTEFNGMAIIRTAAWRDSFELWGGLDDPKGHALHFQWRPTDGTYPPGFVINNLKGQWQDHTITLEAAFAFFRPDGSSFYDSADTRHDQKAKLTLQREPQK